MYFIYPKNKFKNYFKIYNHYIIKIFKIMQILITKTKKIKNLYLNIYLKIVYNIHLKFYY